MDFGTTMVLFAELTNPAGLLRWTNAMSFEVVAP